MGILVFKENLTKLLKNFESKLSQPQCNNGFLESLNSLTTFCDKITFFDLWLSIFDEIKS